MQNTPLKVSSLEEGLYYFDVILQRNVLVIEVNCGKSYCAKAIYLNRETDTPEVYNVYDNQLRHLQV